MPRKGENIYKRSDGRWEGRYIKSRSPAGKAKYGYVYSKSYRETKAKLLQAISNRTQQCVVPVLPDPTPMCFQSLVEAWTVIKFPRTKESTNAKYRNMLNSYILPALGSTPLEQITNSLIESFCCNLLQYGGKKGRGLSPKTVSDVLSLIRNILKYATHCGITIFCDVNSLSLKQSPKGMRVLSNNEQKCLCQYLCANLNLLNVGVLLCLFTGLRIGEICALRWDSISLDDCTIHVQRTMQRIQTPEGSERKTKIIITTPKSNCSLRTIPLPAYLVGVLSQFDHTPNGYVLTGDNNTFIEPRTMQNHFKRILSCCSINDANFHALRHTFATRCIELGIDVKTLSEILGHASVTITMNRYVHPSLEMKRNSMERLSTLLAVK